ncbi:oxidoreductase [Pseudomonas duriflava]|nr:oxidoreductase [Pseudomonas duriflava]
MSSSTPVRVALIGFGFVGEIFHAPLIRSVEGFRLTHIASRQAAKVHACFPDVTVLEDYKAAVSHPDVDLVVLATPNSSHAPLAEAALRAGKHVVVDKPFTLTLTEARHLSRLADSTGQLLSVFQNRRWDSDFLGVRNIIESGTLGDVVVYESRIERFRPEVRQRWRESSEPGSGLWYDLGPHLADQALCLFGIPHRVTAHLLKQRQGAQTDDWFHVVLDYGRTQAILQAGMLSAGGAPRFLLQGSRGSILKQGADRQEDALRQGTQPGAPGWGIDPDPAVFFDGDGTSTAIPVPAGDHAQYYRLLLRALRGEAENPVSPAQGCALMSIIEAAQHSAYEGMSVVPDLTDRERAAWR